MLLSFTTQIEIEGLNVIFRYNTDPSRKLQSAFCFLSSRSGRWRTHANSGRNGQIVQTSPFPIKPHTAKEPHSPSPFPISNDTAVRPETSSAVNVDFLDVLGLVLGPLGSRLEEALREGKGTEGCRGIA
jgi:hypothetical protein